jgi:hypothetical protein
MAPLHPWGQKLAKLLKDGPANGPAHRWIFHLARHLVRILPEQAAYDFLRSEVDRKITHRIIPDREIRAALHDASAGQELPAYKKPTRIPWPEPNPQAMGLALLYPPLCSTSPTAPEAVPASVAIRHLFPDGSLICHGPATTMALIAGRDTVADLGHAMQFVVANPMKGKAGKTKDGRISARCQDNVEKVLYQVVEFDGEDNKGHQARFLNLLAHLVPCGAVVDSGGKSLHGWFRVDHMDMAQRLRFFGLACMLGADPTKWDPAGWVRMPGGQRPTGDGLVRQRVLFLGVV